MDAGIRPKPGTFEYTAVAQERAAVTLRELTARTAVKIEALSDRRFTEEYRVAERE